MPDWLRVGGGISPPHQQGFWSRGWRGAQRGSEDLRIKGSESLKFSTTLTPWNCWTTERGSERIWRKDPDRLRAGEGILPPDHQRLWRCGWRPAQRWS